MVRRGLIRKGYALVVASALIAGPALACLDAGEVPRTIVALYDGDRVPSARATRIHRYAEMALNHLGYRLLYRDVSQGFPAWPEQPVAATISWFDAPVGDPVNLAAGLAAPTGSCGETPALLVLGETGLTDAVASLPDSEAYLDRLGVALEPGEVALGAYTSVERMNDEVLDFETDFTLPMGPHPRITARDAAASQLRLRSNEAPIDLLVAAPGALYADDSVLLREDPRGGALWIADPIRLFEAALAGPVRPIPDTTTLSGRRVYFATVASEGWLMRLPAQEFGDQPPLASEVLSSDLIEPYPDLPVSVALLLGDLDPDIAGPAASRGREIAAHLLGLPQVQPATSGRSMIRDWGFFAAYDAGSEAEVLASGVRDAPAGSLVASAVQTLGDAFSGPAASALDITPFAPRKYANLAFDLSDETGGAVAVVAEMAPGAQAPLYVWSGNAEPFAGAIAEVSAAGARNLGGGGGAAPVTHPSLSQFWPLGLETDGGLQVYDALGGDAIYTNFWSSDLSGFQMLRQTLERTEAPRRLKPFHLSFAARSAVDFASRIAVMRNLELARGAEVTPVTAARYTGAVSGFMEARTIAEGPLAWRIEDRGDLQTVRFDAAAGLALDLGASEGVLGARRTGPSLYVALDPDMPVPRIVLGEDDAATGMIHEGTAPALVEARAEVLAMARADCTTRATLLGYGEAGTEWIAAPNRTYEVTLYGPNGADRAYWEQVATDAEGMLSVRLPLPPGLPAEISITDACSRG